MLCLQSLFLDGFKPSVIEGLGAVPGRLVLHDGVDGVVADSVLARHLVVRHAAVVKPVAPDDVLQIIVSISDRGHQET